MHQTHGRTESHHGRPWHAGAELGAHLEHDLCLGQAPATSCLLGCSTEFLHIYGQPQLLRLLRVSESVVSVPYKPGPTSWQQSLASSQ